jgi:dipeptidyl aminopeptidase/acylaminoacyl peptidase
MAADDQDAPGRDLPATPFHDLTAYVALPRLSGLAISPDGRRLVTAIAAQSADGKKYVSALWELDPAGERDARRLTRSAPGESRAEFLPDGGLLFASRRTDPTASPDEKPEELSTLWTLPAGGGESRPVATRGSGISEFAVARDSGDVVYLASVLPGSTSAEEDDRRRKARKDAGVNAILHDRHPVRFWDHDLGPGQSRLFAAGQVPADGRITDPRDLTPVPEGRLDEGLTVSADGRTAAIVWRVADKPAADRPSIAVLDAITGDRKLMVEEPGMLFFGPVLSPDGRTLVCLREGMGSYDETPIRTLWHVDLDTGTGRDLLPAATSSPNAPVFSADGRHLYYAADELGHAPVFRLDLTDDSVTRLTSSGAYSDVVVAPDGATLYALRSAIDEPPTPVRLAAATADQQPVPLRSPATAASPVPGTVTEVTTEADDGVALRAWLALPHGASADSPAPLIVFIHGGPVSSSNAWSWRWNPWLLVAHGYAVLMPDPALSTGYGADFLKRGWGTWGERPYTDLMDLTDAACAREDIDDTRTGAMGGSFGGYMANWVATKTDRFKAIVTHASLWHLDGFAGTTDEPSYWVREFGDPLTQPDRYTANSPHLYVGNIRTPMLVIHGDKDYRVPIGEALRLWYDLCRFEVPAKFLYFPEENHWVLTPGHARVWYEVVTAFLAQHVLGKDWEQPALV